MSVRWERFSGDTSTFAIKIAFHADPDDGQGADADTARSWGALQVWVDGINLCAHVDQGETLQSAHWYLLSTLEWLASNWDPLLHGHPAVTRPQRTWPMRLLQCWLAAWGPRRHSLRMNTDLRGNSVTPFALPATVGSSLTSDFAVFGTRSRCLGTTRR